MDEYTAEALVNRDEPIPVISFDDASGADIAPGKRHRLKRALTHRRTVSDGQRDGPANSLQDRIFAR
jgi:hypothetical protein